MLALVLGQFASVTVFFAQTVHNDHEELVTQNFPAVRGSAAIGSFADTVLALTLIYLLRRQRSEFNRMNSLIERMEYTLDTGLLTESWLYVIGSGFIVGALELAGVITSLTSSSTPFFPPFSRATNVSVLS